jgi:tRNA/tmRNA/rRNA uracil-C5-methylase (TrmA/RlmC/RlmD family)
LIDFIVSSAVEDNGSNSNNNEKSTDGKADKKTNKKNTSEKMNEKTNDKKPNNQQNIPINKKKKVVVADMMAGVGPFGVPLAMNNITVYANDLNPESYKYLDKNMKVNHCERYLKTYNMCGR